MQNQHTESQQHFNILTTNYLKTKQKNPTYNSIQKNKILRNKSYQGNVIFLQWKL